MRQRHALIPGKPIETILDDLLGRSISDFLGSDFTFKQPSVNIIEDGNSFTIEMAAPGLEKSDFNIEIDKGGIIISSKNADDKEVDAVNFKRREFSYASFKRSFTLPENIDKESIRANYKDGILYVIIEKVEKEEDRKKTIEIL